MRGSTGTLGVSTGPMPNTLLPTVPYSDIAAINAAYLPGLERDLRSIFARGRFVLGPEVERFEHDFATYIGVRHGVGVASGTAALHLGLLALGIGAGDEVITTAMTFAATGAAIRQTGATPVFVDIAADQPLIDVDLIEAAITPRTRAILPVHLYGHACDMDRITAIAARHGLAVLEDVAQAHGAKWRGRRLGSFGHVAAYSCYPGKNLGALGDAGIVTTDDPALAERIRAMRNWGGAGTYEGSAFNYRIDAIQGALLVAKLPDLDRANDARRHHAAGYTRALKARAGASSFFLPDTPDGSHSVFHVYHLLTSERDGLRAHLAAAGIETMVHYNYAMNRHPAFADCGTTPCPRAERFAAETLSLPVSPSLSPTDQDQVVEVLHRYVDTRATTGLAA